MTTWKSFGGGLYQHAGTKTFYERFKKPDGKWTFESLDSHKADLARDEIAARRTKRNRVASGLEKEENPQDQKQIRHLIAAYKAAGCPDEKLYPRTGKQLYDEVGRLDQLREFWGKVSVTQVFQDRDKLVEDYFRFRTAKAKHGRSARRATDMELNALSNVFRFQKVIPNPMLGRQKFYDLKRARHCRERRPMGGDELHSLIDYFFSNPKSEVLGWQLAFEALTGCRVSEIVELRIDAADINSPGFVDQDGLWLNRRKDGVNPYVVLGDRPELRDLLAAHRNWLKQRYPKSKWYFPGRTGKDPVSVMSLTHGLKRACVKMGTKNIINSHSLRAFYVTVRRAQGKPDAQIAGEIGDQSVILMQTTYGGVPRNWRGGPQDSFLPSKGEPAWARWRPKGAKVIQLPTQNQPDSCITNV